jgi:hypothetical protein
MTYNDSRGLYMFNSTIVHMSDCSFVGNSDDWAQSAIELRSASEITIWLGNNELRNNESHGIYLDQTSKAIVGDSPWYPGNNAFFEDPGHAQNGKYIYNLALTWDGYNYYNWTVPAEENYWGGTPSGSDFHGSVDYSPYLTSNPNEGPSPKTEAASQPSRRSAPPELSPAYISLLRSRIEEAIDAVRADPSSAISAKHLRRIERWLALDRRDATGMRSAVDELYSDVASVDDLDRLEVERIKSAYAGVTEDSGYSVEAGTINQVDRLIRSGQYEQAGELISRAQRVISNRDNRSMLHQYELVLASSRDAYDVAFALIDSLSSVTPERGLEDSFVRPDYGVLIDHFRVASGLEPVHFPAKSKLAARPIRRLGENQTEETPTSTSLGNAYPNPTTDASTVELILAEDSNVAIEIIDLLGRRAGKIPVSRLDAGRHELMISTSALSSGVYWLSATVRGDAGGVLNFKTSLVVAR